jgi:hypothetical protein
VSGKIDEAKLLPLINDSFSPIAAPARALETTYTVEPVQDGERRVTLRRVGDIQAVLAAYHVPAGSDPDFAAINVLMGVLGDNPSGRLYKALVDGKKAAAVLATALQLSDPGAAVLGAVVNQQDSVDQARTILLDTIGNLVKEPPSKEEVDRARTRVLAGIDLQLRNSEQIGLTMSEWVSKGDWRLLFLNGIIAQTPQDVQRVASVSEAERDGRRIHSRPQAGSLGDPRPGGCRRHAEGLQGDTAMARRSVRSVAGQRGRSSSAPRCRGHESVAVVEADRGNTVSAPSACTTAGEPPERTDRWARWRCRR